MNRTTGSIAALALTALLLAGCSTTPETVTTPDTMPSTAPSPTPTPEPVEQQLGTRENPIPYGQTVTIEDIGEIGGPAWSVTIDEPRDMSEEILARAVEMYGDDEMYTASSRPEEGATFIGFTGTVGRLMDQPASPGGDLDTSIIGTDGNTYNAVQLGLTPPEEYLFNIAEMYAPATARFSNVQQVPVGTAVGQVLVTMRNTGERFYFGAPPQ